jgi:SpoVK/Ycf46/Vps4 family AAA+-type ATPase
MNDVLLLPRFFQQVRLHLWASYLHLPAHAPIMGFFGRPGDGKSAQLAAALERCNVEVLRINASDLESGLAGEPGKLIARTYSAGSEAVRRGVPTALLVDDIDTTVGEWEQNTGTVNHQQILAELMHIADRPVDPGHSRPCRVPVFVTGNNLLRIYPPLRRHGRMAPVEWLPTRQEVAEVVHWLLGAFADGDSIGKLLVEFDAEPLAYFAEVRTMLLRSHMLGHLEQSPADMRTVLRERVVRGNAMRTSQPRFDETAVLEAARTVHKLRSSVLRDYLYEPAKGAE